MALSRPLSSVFAKAKKTCKNVTQKLKIRKTTDTNKADVSQKGFNSIQSTISLNRLTLLESSQERTQSEVSTSKNHTPGNDAKPEPSNTDTSEQESTRKDSIEYDIDEEDLKELVRTPLSQLPSMHFNQDEDTAFVWQAGEAVPEVPLLWDKSSVKRK